MKVVFSLVACVCLAAALPARFTSSCGGYLDIYPGPVALLCPGDTLRLDAVGFMVDPPFTWSTGQTGDFIEVSSPGYYSVHSADGCGHGWVEVIPFDSSWMDSEFFDTLCPGSSTSLRLPFGNGIFTWDDGTFPYPREVSQGGSYTLHVELPCASWDVQFEVSEHDTSMVFLPDVFLCEPDTILFECPFPYCDWQTPSPGTETLPVTAPGIYTFMTYLSCPRSYAFTVLPDPACSVSVIPDPQPSECQLSLPNVFTPNDDGIGDLFRTLSSCEFEAWHLIISDRWGRMVFETTDPSSGWDGRKGWLAAPEGVYFWMVDASRNGRQLKGAGPLTLLR